MTSEQRSYLISQQADSISKYIDLSKTSVSDFASAFQAAVRASNDLKPFPQIRASINKQLQGIMLPVFKM